jgi:outer membrane protein TolC
MLVKTEEFQLLLGAIVKCRPVRQLLDVLGKHKQRIAAAAEAVLRSQADFELAPGKISQRVKVAYWAARGSHEIRDVLRKDHSR